MKKRSVHLLAAALILVVAGCSSNPKYPTAKSWKKTPILQRDKIDFVIQGSFKNVKDFLAAASRLKDGMGINQVGALGFVTSVKAKSPCETIGWLDASDMALKNMQLQISSIDAGIREKRQYEGIRCRAIDAKTRTDRMFTYFNNRDSFKIGWEIELTLIFKNKKLFGVNLNNKPVKGHERERAFGKVIGDLLSPPSIAPKVPIN